MDNGSSGSGNIPQSPIRAVLVRVLKVVIVGILMMLTYTVGKQVYSTLHYRFSKYTVLQKPNHVKPKTKIHRKKKVSSRRRREYYGRMRDLLEHASVHVGEGAEPPEEEGEGVEEEDDDYVPSDSASATESVADSDGESAGESAGDESDASAGENERHGADDVLMARPVSPPTNLRRRLPRGIFVYNDNSNERKHVHHASFTGSASVPSDEEDGNSHVAVVRAHDNDDDDVDDDVNNNDDNTSTQEALDVDE